MSSPTLAHLRIINAGRLQATYLSLGQKPAQEPASLFIGQSTASPLTALSCCFYYIESNLFSMELKATSLTTLPSFPTPMIPFLYGCLGSPACQVGTTISDIFNHHDPPRNPTTHTSGSWALLNGEPVLAG